LLVEEAVGVRRLRAGVGEQERVEAAVVVVESGMK